MQMRKEWLLRLRFCTELNQTVLNSLYGKINGVRRCGKTGICLPPWKLGLRTKIF